MARSFHAHLRAFAACAASSLGAMACGHDWDSFDPRGKGASAQASSSTAASVGSGGGQAAGGAGGSAGPSAGGSGGAGASPPSYRDVILADAPVGYWRLGDASFSEAFDEVALAHHGTYVGAVSLGEPGAIAGDAGAAIRLDGATGQVVIGDYLDFPGMAAFSVEAWIRPDDVQPAPCCSMIVSKQVAPLDDGWQIGFAQDGQAAFVAREVDPLYELVGAPIPTGKYVHVVGTFASPTLRLYIDGTEAQAIRSTVLLSDHSAPLKIGARDAGEAYAGLIDEVAVYDHALSAERVLAHFIAAGTP
ncbi:MAG: LamG domain-containing protein [Polyangiaceae bacterium]